MNLGDLESFVAIVEEGSFLGAANRLGASRSTLRRVVERLEATAGVPLLQRDDTGLRPTAAGRMLAQRAGPLLADLGGLIGAVTAVGQQAVPLLRVAISTGLPAPVIVLIERMVCAAEPHLRLDTLYCPDPLSEVPERADAALCWTTQELKPPLISRRIAQVRLQLLASEPYLEAHGLPRDVDDLRHHDLLISRFPGRDPNVLPLVGGGVVAVHPRRISNNHHALRLAAQAGDGIAFVPNPRGGADPETPDLLPILTDKVGTSTAAVVVTTETLMDHAPVSALITDFLPMVSRYLVDDP